MITEAEQTTIALPAGADGSVHVIAAGTALECRDDRWRRALAIVEHGCVELVTGSGARLRVGEGAMFSLARLGPVVLYAVGTGGAVVTLIVRRPHTGAAGD